jgi:uroporphyrinogen decarboxylase
LDAITLVKQTLAPRGIPLLGFAGALFTLACYAIEGGSSQQFATARTFMLSQPAAWKRLMTRLVTVSADFLIEQVKAGADAVQVFDTWAGLLSAADYQRYVKPYNTMLFAALARTGVPVINFSTGTAAILEEVAACGGDVIGIDWRVPLDTAWSRIPEHRAVMGNLDPVTLFAPWRELRRQVDDILRRAEGHAGYIFNLGHGILPQTPVDNVRRVIDYVHERTSVAVHV